MFSIRCTKKLLDRGRLPVDLKPSPATTVLGDWYANVLVARPQHLVLCISEKTLLPLVVPAKDLQRLPERLAVALEAMLISIGVPNGLVRAELEEMVQSSFAKTESRSVLGSLNDFMFHLQDGCASNTSLSLHERALQLANMPSGALEFAFPSDQALSLFKARHAIHVAQGEA